MTSIITRAGKSSALTHTELDNNLKSLAGIVTPKTAAYTINDTDQGSTIEVTPSADITISITAITTILTAIDTVNFKVTIKNLADYTVTIDPSGSEAFDDGAITKSLAMGRSITIETNNAGTAWNVLSMFDGQTITGTYTSASIAVGSSLTDADSIDISALGTDDISFGFTAKASVTNLVVAATIEIQDPNGFVSSFNLGGTSGTFYDFISPPSTGKLSVLIDNNHGTTAQVITINWWAKAR